jgi:hypothetical protein
VIPPAVEVHELVAWGLDKYAYRATTQDEAGFAKIEEHAREALLLCAPYAIASPLLQEETIRQQHLLDPFRQRADLHLEYRSFIWDIAIVDLRHILAFQRRLVFNPTRAHTPVPQQNDWNGLAAYAFDSPRATKHCMAQRNDAKHQLQIYLYSENPDLQLRLTRESGSSEIFPLSLYGGCPFFEVAEYRGRWFLRDGYHRAYRLLQNGVNWVPAVILRARTIGELGAADSCFFDESQLFSDRPPKVTDFLDDNLTFRYQRTALRKAIRICIEESLEPFDNTENEKGEQR